MTTRAGCRFAALFLSCWLTARGSQGTIVEYSLDTPPPTFLGGATCDYGPTKTERKFYNRLKPNARLTVQTEPGVSEESHAFRLHGHQGEFVSWWGIVREIKPNVAGGGELLVENKYFNGVTDCNLFESISISGGGDFETELTDIPAELIPLVLVRVYGVVTRERDKPLIKAQYVRVWHWSQFAFFSYGEDHGNPEWKKNTKLEADENPYIHNSAGRYYRDHLGPTADQLKILKEFYERETLIQFANIPLQSPSSTAGYDPTEMEKQYFERLNNDDRITVESKSGESVPAKFQLRGHVGQFVSWFGIVREVATVSGRRGASVLIENKYFRDDGCEYPHTISVNGGGNFKADMTRLAEGLPLLLVRVYGTVVREDGTVPVVQAKYVRVWRWGEFNFSDYGEDRGDSRWKGKLTVSSTEADKMQSLSADYYIERLGPTAKQTRVIRRFFDALEQTRKAGGEIESAIEVEFPSK